MRFVPDLRMSPGFKVDVMDRQGREVAKHPCFGLSFGKLPYIDFAAAELFQA